MSQPFDNPNPYQTPGGGYSQFQQPPQGTPGKLLAPAIALIVIAVFDGGYGLVNLIGNAMGGNRNMQIPEGMEDNPFFQGMKNADPMIGIIISIVMIVVSVIILVGGIMMIKRQSYGLAIAASILSMIPCISICACCGVGEGVGIWSLVVLLSQDIKILFR